MPAFVQESGDQECNMLSRKGRRQHSTALKNRDCPIILRLLTLGPRDEDMHVSDEPAANACGRLASHLQHTAYSRPPTLLPLLSPVLAVAPRISVCSIPLYCTKTAMEAHNASGQKQRGYRLSGSAVPGLRNGPTTRG